MFIVISKNFISNITHKYNSNVIIGILPVCFFPSFSHWKLISRYFNNHIILI